MHTEIESATFLAYDSTGTAYTVIAQREIRFQFGSLPQCRPWTFRTDNDHSVRFDAPNACYLIDSSGEMLKSTDPRRPAECGGSG